MRLSIELRTRLRIQLSSIINLFNFFFFYSIPETFNLNLFNVITNVRVNILYSRIMKLY